MSLAIVRHAPGRDHGAPASWLEISTGARQQRA
jgi:hypothetical protein